MSLMGQMQFFCDKAIFIPMQKQESLYSRPYTLTGTESTVRDLAERVIRNNDTGLNVSNLAGVVGNILQPSTVAFPTIATNSWIDDGHYMFYMKIICVGHNNSVSIAHLTGFTDHMGYTKNTGQVLDKPIGAYVGNKEMVLTFNSLYETVPVTDATANGHKTNEIVRRHFDILNAQRSRENIFLLRPSDVSREIKLNASGIGGMESFNAMGQMNGHSPLVHTSNSENNIGMTYLTKTVNDTIRQQKIDEVAQFGRIEEDSAMTNPAYREPSFGDNLFIKALARLKGTITASENIELKYIERLVPDFDNKTFVNDYNNDQLGSNMYGQFSPNDGVDWASQDITTIIGQHMLVQAVALAGTMCVSNAVVKVDTTTSPMFGPHMAVCLGGQAFITYTDVANKHWIMTYMTRLFNEVISEESRYGENVIRAEFHIDLLGTSKVYLSYNNQPSIWIRMPSVLSGFTPPVTTISGESKHEIVSRFQHMIDEVGDAISGNNPALNKMYSDMGTITPMGGGLPSHTSAIGGATDTTSLLNGLLNRQQPNGNFGTEAPQTTGTTTLPLTGGTKIQF